MPATGTAHTCRSALARDGNGAGFQTNRIDCIASFSPAYGRSRNQPL
jgi:hypothetical protein